MQYTIDEASYFVSGDELETEYYRSRILEVRAGIIHALLKGTSCSGEGFTRAWKIKFVLQVCKECAIEAAKLCALNDSTPYPKYGIPHEETMNVLDRKNAWISKMTTLSKISSLCVMNLMGTYASEYHHWSGNLDSAAVDATGEEILSLISNWETARCFQLQGKPNGETTKAFLDAYRSKHHGKALPDAWFQAVIQSEVFVLFNFSSPQEREAANPQIKAQLISHLKRLAIKEDVPLKLSSFAPSAFNRSIEGRFIAEFFLEFLQKTRELDPVIDFA